MPSNLNRLAERLEAGHPGRLGLLFSPDGWADPLGLPYALDNGRYACWAKGSRWDRAEYLRLLDRASAQPAPPLWCIVPDVVADRGATLSSWGRWAPWLAAEFSWPLAAAVQDGMTPADVRGLSPAPSVVFVGGTTRFKWRTLRVWCREFPRVHVGRVNTYGLLWSAHEAGAESSDGTGWWHVRQLEQLERYLARSRDGLGRDGRRRMTG